MNLIGDPVIECRSSFRTFEKRHPVSELLVKSQLIKRILRLFQLSRPYFLSTGSNGRRIGLCRVGGAQKT